MMMKSDATVTFRLLATLALAVGAFACGDDTDDDSGDDPVDAAMSMPVVDSGPADDPMDPPASSVTCEGDLTCDTTVMIPIVNIELSPCCADGIDDDGNSAVVCGAGMGAMGCAQLNAPGEDDPVCPTESIMGFIDAGGCCRPDGKCGVDVGIVMFGCIARGDPGLSMFVSTASDEIDCDPGNPGEAGGEDAGAEADGG